MISTPQFVYGFCAGFFVAELLLVWIFRSMPPKTPNTLTDEAERWTYTVVDDGAMYVGEKLHVCPLDGQHCACVPPFVCQPRMSDYSTLTAIAIRHNQPEARN